jgi:type II secretion system protein G
MLNISNKKTLKAGFTLIELLVVVAIIGILASIVLASLNTARQRSRDARRVADVKQIQLALELYFDSCGEYPDTYTGTVASPPVCNTLGNGLTPAFLQVAPLDPITQTAYPYDNYQTFSTPLVDCSVSGATGNGVCIFYKIGALLEEAGTGALRSDRDLDGVIGVGPDGLSTNIACAVDAAAVASNDRCYDVTP